MSSFGISKLVSGTFNFPYGVTDNGANVTISHTLGIMPKFIILYTTNVVNYCRVISIFNINGILQGQGIAPAFVAGINTNISFTETEIKFFMSSNSVSNYTNYIYLIGG